MSSHSSELEKLQHGILWPDMSVFFYSSGSVAVASSLHITVTNLTPQHEDMLLAVVFALLSVLSAAAGNFFEGEVVSTARRGQYHGVRTNYNAYLQV